MSRARAGSGGDSRGRRAASYRSEETRSATPRTGGARASEAEGVMRVPRQPVRVRVTGRRPVRRADAADTGRAGGAA
ncbi:hypothetical protein GCM10019016_085400 [Streptomyces prasinosporus]|uniref:Uncharacterized protein n=1 Tax=Streptomyces prasinosporus TaxID=68256 RepID=A0ABP6U433_9ACTN